MKISELENIRDIIIKRLDAAPEGSLNIKKKNKSVQYYQHIKIDNEFKNRYIKKDNYEFAARLAQKYYDKKILRLINDMIRDYNRSLYNKSDLEIIYDNLIPERRALIHPVIQPWKDFVSMWYKRDDKFNNYKKENKIHETKSGLMVRSKSEKFIADLLYDYNIPFKYEMAVYLEGYKIVYPDFTILSKDRKQIYWEHLGMLDESRYLNSNILKIEAYRKNGYFLDRDLILTFESSEYPLKSSEVEMLIKNIVLK